MKSGTSHITSESALKGEITGHARIDGINSKNRAKTAIFI